jgi:hypothetical protein
MFPPPFPSSMISPGFRVHLGPSAALLGRARGDDHGCHRPAAAAARSRPSPVRSFAAAAGTPVSHPSDLAVGPPRPQSPIIVLWPLLLRSSSSAYTRGQPEPVLVPPEERPSSHAAGRTWLQRDARPPSVTGRTQGPPRGESAGTVGGWNGTWHLSLSKRLYTLSRCLLGQ